MPAIHQATAPGSVAGVVVEGRRATWKHRVGGERRPVQLAAPGSAVDGLGEQLMVGGVRATRAKTFADGQPGRLIVYVDSAGKVALAVNGGRAVVALAVSPGDVLRIASRA